MDLSQKLLETGMVVRAQRAQTPKACATGKGELAEPSHFTQMLAIWGELIDIAVLTHNLRYVPFEVRRREMERRFVRDTKNPQYPLIVKAMIAAERVTRFDRATRQHFELPGVGLGYKTQIQVPDNKDVMQTVSAVPHILVNGCGGIIPYGKFEETPAGLVVNAAEHFCLVIRPLKSTHPHRLVPLGLASPSRLDMWNRVAEGLPARKLPKIEPIHHNLFAKEGARYLVYTPPGMWKSEDSDKESEHAATYNFGHICGQTARLITSGNFPPYDDEEACTFSEPRVFLVVLGERSIGLQYVGRKGEVKLLHGTIDLGQQFAIDPFVALGISVVSANPYDQARRAYDLAARGELSVENPIFAYAVQIGLVDPIQLEDGRVVRSSLNRLAALVVQTLRQQLDDMKTRIVHQLVIEKLPNVNTILSGKSADEVWYQNSGPDAMVDWINVLIDGTFDWNSWLHRGVRMELLKRVSHDQFSPPRKQGNGAPVPAPVLSPVPAPVPASEPVRPAPKPRNVRKKA